MNANSPGSPLSPLKPRLPTWVGGRNVLTIAGLQEALRQTHNLGYRDNLNFKMTRRRVASVPSPRPCSFPSSHSLRASSVEPRQRQNYGSKFEKAVKMQKFAQ